MSREINRVEKELLRGAGVLAVLKLLEQKDWYGYELAQALDQRSEGLLALGHSTLYPMLYNLEAKRLIESYLGTSESGRRRKYYRLTKTGTEMLRDQENQWGQLVEAMAKLGVSTAEAGPGGEG